MAVTAERPPAHLNEDNRQLRRGLRAKARQLGDQGENLDLLVTECAYEQWHRLLFARFLAENNLLIHPEYQAPVTLDDCEELAESLGEPDGWSVAARFAAEILPGIFRFDDPCVRLRLAPEGRLSLESIIAGLPGEVFAGDDALGWVYQFWQKDKKDEVNASERKIGGADLAPVTQLFTENYMVRFLLENSLGAWWTARHPDSPLIKEFDYLRFNDDGKPAAGAFDSWPNNVGEVTVMDPCCGSGHFLVEAFMMLWRMRVEDEGLTPVDAQDAVLRENVFGLELDPRCVQIAMFAVALAAWKAGGSWRELPVPNVACSGIPVKASVDDWKALARGDTRLESALGRLHILFRDADTLGSFIDPKRAVRITDRAGLQPSFEDIEWIEVAPLLIGAQAREFVDPAVAVLRAEASELAVAADLLSRQFTLIATNVPWLKRASQSAQLTTFIELYHPDARDLATAFVHRWMRPGYNAVSTAFVSPQNWLTTVTLKQFRKWMLSALDWRLAARLGPGAFETITGEVVNPLLLVTSPKSSDSTYLALDVPSKTSARDKAAWLRTAELIHCNQNTDLGNPDSRVTFYSGSSGSGELLSAYADGLVGIQTGDDPRYKFWFWEVADWGTSWERLQDVPVSNSAWSGCTGIVRWEGGRGPLAQSPAARIQGVPAWGRKAVIVSRFGTFYASLYRGTKFHQNAAVILPFDDDLTGAVLAFCQSPEFEQAVRRIDKKWNVTNATLVKVPFDAIHWQKVSDAAGPLAKPQSDDPTQWLFHGRPEASTQPLQVAVARLVGYRWPEQANSDRLNSFADVDGVVCLPSVAGEAPASDRLQQVLTAAFDALWSPSKATELLATAGSTKKNLRDWLRDDFFRQHCALFENRPFVWHVWDGQRDGFAALVNYHKVDRKTLEKLTYTYLGDWVERQRGEVRDEVAGAEGRLAAALKLRKSLELVLEGEPPYDVYVRWKSLAEQPLGWDPDFNDGVRVNVRPFVEAGVLRSAFNIHWQKDRGKNSDGSDRLNDRHLTTTEKWAARGSSA